MLIFAGLWVGGILLRAKLLGVARFGAVAVAVVLGTSIGLAASAAAQTLQMFNFFSSTTLNVGDTTALTFALGTTPPHPVRTQIGFVDNLPSGLVVASPNGLSGFCPGGTITAVPGSSVITLSGAAFNSITNACTFSINVKAVAPGTKTNAVQVTSFEEAGNVSHDTMMVNPGAASAVAAIHNFLSRRNDLLLSNGPDANRQIDRLAELRRGGSSAIAGLFGATDGASRLGGALDGDMSQSSVLRRATAMTAFSDTTEPSRSGVPSPVRLTGTMDGVTDMRVSASLRQLARAQDAAEANRMSGLGLGLGAALPARRPSPFDVWVEGRFARFNDDRSGAGLGGHFGVLYAGADYVVNSSLLVGALVQFDSMSERSLRQPADVSGNGWMAGPYATLRLADSIFLQGRVAWGASSNKVSPYLFSTDAFETDRWLVSGRLTGTFDTGPWTIRPSASISYIEDNSKSYTDSFGALVPGVKSRLGQVKVGPEVSYTYALPDGATIAPRLALDAIWNFAADDLVGVDGALAGPEGVRGRVELGLRAMNANGFALDLSASYDGIGTRDFDAIVSKLMVRVPLGN